MSRVPKPNMTTSTQVIEKPQCIGCLNIFNSNWPVSFYRDTGLARMDTESQWNGLDGAPLNSIAFNFCPVCGRSLKELAQDSNYLS